MKKVTIIMSAYNGSKYIKEQLDSIFCQKDVEVTCFVRDDGSTDDTLQVLNRYTPQLGKLIVVDGENVGWEKSFLMALRDAPKGDYYAFADQDDIWFDDKLATGVNMLEKLVDMNMPCMYHCNKISVTEDLKPLSHQVKRIPKPLNRKNALIQEYAQGCSILLNEEARQLVCKHLPKHKIAHDFWCGLICYLFGVVVYDDRPHFYHISHGTNASGEGHLWKSRISRLKGFFFENHTYRLPMNDLIVGYSDLLKGTDIKFISKIITYKNSFFDKLYLIFSFHFIRSSFWGTILLKFSILFNKL